MTVVPGIAYGKCMWYDACGSELTSFAWFPIAWRERTFKEHSLIPTAFLFASVCSYAPRTS
jgi:hypothetical protein